MHDPPYIMKNDKDSEPTGFIVDIFTRMKEKLNIKIKYQLNEDGGYGRLKNPDADDSKPENWKGMIGRVARGEACMAVPLTISARREKVIDFSIPIHRSGISILARKAYTQDHFENEYSYTFNIFTPFEVSVWFSCAIGFLAVSLLLWGMNRYNPYEWGLRYDLGRATEYQAQSFNFTGSLWFAYTTLQWQGYERSPRSLSSKVLSAFWFMFVTLTIVTYTGALVNNLFWASTAHYKDFTKPEVYDIYHLVGSNKFDYGVIHGGATYNYIKQRSLRLDSTAQLMMAYWQDEKRGAKYLFNSMAQAMHVMENNKTKKFALIIETGTARYQANNAKRCDFAVVPREIHTRDIGIALPQNIDKDTRDKLNKFLLSIKESGELLDLETIWFEGLTHCAIINREQENHVRISMTELNEPKRIDLSIFKGALILISVGLVMSLFVGIGEILYFKYKGRYQSSNQPGGQQLKIDEDQHI
ncbi:DgyrCDS13270 [Dimorphilus gyrociliatus]|uniref:DgyrCDS13270 n=1 Tax=Dimorphilus gyrociliatus TaxID=2664684 RepID=A0A7I8WA80_9ANNE|nr:DgyrCDS13270 [Dimorphilus gyrociliatus]